jgi:hypothetical protein
MSTEDLIKSSDLVVLRSSLNHRALNVSFSEEGLTYTLDNQGKFIFFKNAWVSIQNGYLIFKGDTRLNDKVYVEKFIPKDFLTYSKDPEGNKILDDRGKPISSGPMNLQKAEYTFMNKALKLLSYNALENQRGTNSWV